MSSTASDTLSVARRLKAAGVEAGQADAIVDAMDQFTGKSVTVEHFDTAVARLDTRIDGLEIRIEGLQARIDSLQVRIDGLKAHIDAVRIELQAGIDALRSEFQASINATRSELQASISANQAAMARFLVIAVGVIIAANALMIGILRFLPRDGAVM